MEFVRLHRLCIAHLVWWLRVFLFCVCVFNFLSQFWTTDLYIVKHEYKHKINCFPL